MQGRKLQLFSNLLIFIHTKKPIFKKEKTQENSKSCNVLHTDLVTKLKLPGRELHGLSIPVDISRRGLRT